LIALLIPFFQSIESSLVPPLYIFLDINISSEILIIALKSFGNNFNSETGDANNILFSALALALTLSQFSVKN